MFDASNAPAPYHYEHVQVQEVSQATLTKQLQAKQEALKVMDTLEGWCSKQKAAVLMDLIYYLGLKKSSLTAVEIGVWGGKSLIPVAMGLRANGIGKIYGIDPWSQEASVVGMDGVNAHWWGQVDHEIIYRGLVQKIKQLGLGSYVELVKCTSKEAAEVSNIDFLHIDGNHSEESAYFDVTKWAPLVVSGGVIVLDDINWTQRGRAEMEKTVAYIDSIGTPIVEFKGDCIWGIWIKN